jgi:hypothetical protein
MRYIIIILLSTFDALATLFGLEQGYLREANPLMRLFLSMGAYHFFLAKLIVTIFGLSALKLFEKQRLAQWGLSAVCSFYAVLTVLHVWYIILWGIGV